MNHVIHRENGWKWWYLEKGEIPNNYTLYKMFLWGWWVDYSIKGTILEGYHHFPNEVTLPETNSSHLKMNRWNRIVSFWDRLFSGAFAVSFRACMSSTPHLSWLTKLWPFTRWISNSWIQSWCTARIGAPRYSGWWWFTRKHGEESQNKCDLQWLAN